VTLTVDRFIAAVPVDDNRVILVYRREHGGRSFVRWRVFHRHRRSGLWYPDKRRAFVVPLAACEALAAAIAAGATGRAVTPEPPWLTALDAGRDYKLRRMDELSAPPKVMDVEIRRRGRAWGLAPTRRKPSLLEQWANRRRLVEGLAASGQIEPDAAARERRDLNERIERRLQVLKRRRERTEQQKAEAQKLAAAYRQRVGNGGHGSGEQ